MAKPQDRTASRRPDGQWANKRYDTERASSVHGTQAEAIEAARRNLLNQGGGELSVQGRSGRIRSKDTIAPGRDPYPPRDTEHRASAFQVRQSHALLREVAEVQLGITLRGADSSRHQPNGTHQLIRIGDVSDDGVLRIAEPNLIKLDAAAAQRSSLRLGEVLLAARGTRMTAAVFDSGVPAVAGSQFLILRPRVDVLLPAFLRWFLNLPATQEVLNAQARGSYVRSLSSSALGELEIPLPALPRQRAIADLYELGQREKQLMESLATQRATLINHSILQTLGV